MSGTRSPRKLLNSLGPSTILANSHRFASQIQRSYPSWINLLKWTWLITNHKCSWS